MQTMYCVGHCTAISIDKPAVQETLTGPSVVDLAVASLACDRATRRATTLQPVVDNYDNEPIGNATTGQLEVVLTCTSCLTTMQ